MVLKLSENNIIFSILLVNDGSTDRSKDIAQALVEKYQNIRLYSLEKPHNIGHAYKLGIKELDTELITWLPSDGEIPSDAIIDCMNSGFQGCCITYPLNTFETRNLYRALLSKVFQKACSLIFCVKLRYFNGSAIFERSKLERLDIQSNGFTINLELCVKYIRELNEPYHEVGFALKRRQAGEEKALSCSNILDVLTMVYRIWRDISFKRKSAKV